MHEIEGEEKSTPEKSEETLVWVDDSGASESQSPHKDVFVRMKHNPQRFKIAKGSIRTEYKGKVLMKLSGSNGEPVEVFDSHTTYNPHLSYGLVATSAWVKRGFAVVHQNNQIVVVKAPLHIEEGQIVARGRALPNNLYVFDPPGMVPLDPNKGYEPVPLGKRKVKVEGDDSSPSTVSF